MPIDKELARFISGPVMIIIGTRDSRNRASIARGMGAWAVHERNFIELNISEWQWPDCAENIRQTGEIAVTFVRPQDYVAYQIKGSATVRPAQEEDRQRAKRYMVDVVEMLGSLGVEPDIAAVWTADREVSVINMDVKDIFLQTPGPRAGSAVGATP
jgi:hypothetical protein